MEEASAIIFMGCCMFLPMILFHFSIDKEIVRTEIKYVYIEKQKKLRESKPINFKQENTIVEDAIECLISLGMKKSDAKIKVNRMFLNKNYESIESFLIDAYKS